ncbi:DUF4091 domain-containing protein [Algibacter agarivorans]
MKNILVSIVVALIGFSATSQTINGSFESKFKRYIKNESFTGTPAQVWDVVAWKGERINKQIVLWSDTDVNSISYSISDLSSDLNQIAASNIRLRFGRYVKGDPEARSCSQYPTHPTFVEIADALSSDELTTMTSSDPIKLWLTIDVPSSTIPGNYSGTITVNGGSSPFIFAINITVVDYALPTVANWNFHLDIWQFPIRILEHYNASNLDSQIIIWSNEHFALFEPVYRLLADGGQKAITTYIKDGALGAESMVEWIKKTDGTWEYDFTVFDQYVTSLMSWGITEQIDCFSPVGWNEETISYWDETTGTTINLNAPLNSNTYSLRWDDFLTAFKIHLDNKGWFDKAILYLDEVSESKLNDVETVVHSNNPNWKLGIAYSHGLSNATKANFYDLSGILESASNDGISENKISTFYTSCTQTQPNNYITPENSPAEMTWMGWHAFNENYDGYLRWAFDNWTKSDPFDARDGSHTAGDFSMVYRASNNYPSEVLSSIRFEMLREGIQDFEKLKILKANLEASSNPYDQEVLNGLNTIIANFDKTSGSGAKQLIIQSQKVIQDIVQGTFTYCKVNGVSDTNYYVKSLTSSGGNNNLNFSASQYPSFGYEHHTLSTINVHPEDNFTLSLVNSNASNCARTKVWIDWNNDNDFDDLEEEIFNAGVMGSCSNSLTYNIPITVPITAYQGVKRIRIQVRDASESEPVACGTNDKTGTADFDLEVLDPYCPVTGTGVYNANKVLTEGGITNIDYAGSRGSNNYVNREDKITISQAQSFNLSVTNSNGWSRSIVWIDWNGDNDFEDIDEQLPPLSPEKVVVGTTPTYTINITVSETAKLGISKIRIVTGDAWTYEDSALPNTPCGIPSPDGTLENSAIKDFIIEVTSSLGMEVPKDNSLLIYPNPVKTKFSINSLLLNNNEAKIHMINSVGQIMYSKKIDSFQSPQTIALPSTLENGLYVLMINSLSRVFTSKLIVN